MSRLDKLSVLCFKLIGSWKYLTLKGICTMSLRPRHSTSNIPFNTTTVQVLDLSFQTVDHNS